jgi:hypothetical protein
MGGPIKGLPTTLNGEGRSDIPFLGRHGAEASPTSTMTIQQPENPLVDQATMIHPPQQVTPQSDDNLPLEQRRACEEAAQRWNEPGSGQVATVAGPS